MVLPDPKRTLLAVFAHPDDEAFGSGGNLALNAAKGHCVALVTATRGEVGEISDPALATPENLGQVREGELRATAAALGVHDLTILGYRDSGMDGTEDNANPKALANADQQEVVASLVEIMRRLRPDVVITFDENGGYGHPDHIAINRHTVAAFHASGDASSFEGKGEPWSPGRLYYVVFPKSIFSRLREALIAHGEDASDFDRFEESGLGWDDDKVHATIDVTGVIDEKWKALNSHKTQFGADSPFNRIPVEATKALMSREHLVQVHPEPPNGVAYTDVFEGL
ncbi:MAG: PIG-L family deacetylase [SAR202 cluster bacterium]|jgi:LmbE family N-acetylglucosaminyl deacetylase|nr:PIG-L family deacetylase [SAR202 cluster bacterium]|tara:strand:- start:1924 stop:2775 length:852 start_codon:yes stop_codon:yes gene_type:complete